MISNVKISVIVPVYNVEEYLRECLDSIIGQTFRDMEIICINDGSTDSSLAILEEYAKKDIRIKIINQSNQGLSLARQSGLDIAQGEYIAFVDSDDIMGVSDAYELALEKMNGVDIVCFGTKLIGDISLIQLGDVEYCRVKYEGYQLLTNDMRLKVDVMAWNKIFKKSIIDKYQIKFVCGLIYEDANFYWKYIMVAREAYFIKQEFYFYRKRAGSIMHKTINKSPRSMDHLLLLEDVYDFYIKNDLFAKNKDLFSQLFISSFWFVFYHYPTSDIMKVFYAARLLAIKFFSAEPVKSKFIKNLIKQRYYRVVKSDLSFFQKIFSIGESPYERYKILTIFGIRLRTFIEKTTDKND